MGGAKIIRMGILDNAKEVANAVHEIKNIDLYSRVLDLNRGIIDIVEENRKLHAEVEEQKRHSSSKKGWSSRSHSTFSPTTRRLSVRHVGSLRTPPST
jgi:hypothetical protein